MLDEYARYIHIYIYTFVEKCWTGFNSLFCFIAEHSIGAGSDRFKIAQLLGIKFWKIRVSLVENLHGVRMENFFFN